MGLRAAVAAGTGFTGWHGGIADSYRASSDYLQLVGGQFATHPSRHPSELVEGSEENNYLSYTIELTDLGRRHPITEGIDDFELTTEQYWVLHDDLIDVLATTTHPVQPWHPWHRPITSPAIWTRLWGDGRIVVTTPGTAPTSSRTRTSAPSSKGACCGPPAPHRHRRPRGHLPAVPGRRWPAVPSVRITAVADLDARRAPRRRRRAARCPGDGRRRAARAAPTSTPSST